MAGSFRNRIQIALDNPVLQSALDGNAERRLQARQSAFSSLPEDLQTLRQRAHAVRRHTIEHLEEYLAQFSQAAQANGLQVHHAADAEQANKIILEIVQKSNARVVAKSKTMVGEEIGVNHALEQAGIQVVETDLGEYIVQLRGEPPSHIITPAVHLTRSQVGQTFVEKLGVEYTEDIHQLTAIARSVLRQVFLNAHVGISGVNFGVAETGSLCIVTNEGNGRMVTTLPAVHIALMGIERLVPTLDDLALMLRLLPRSATGQKLTVYTSLIQAPRRPAEADGPVERHVILIDNGRRQMRGSPLREGLYCIRCGACLNACPVFREIGGHVYQGISGKNTPYPGPIGSVISPGLFGQPEFSHLARASSLCGACKEACPVDIDLPKLLLRVRAGMAGSSVDVVPGHAPQPTSAPKSLKLGLRMFTWAAASPRRYHAAQRLAGWISRAASPGTDWLKLPARTGWGTSRDFPRPAMQSFSAWVKKNPVKHTGQRVAEETLSTEKDSPSLQPPSGGLTPPEADGSDLACAPQSTPEARLRRFESELSTLGGSVSRCQRAELAGTILDWLEAHHTTRMLAWEQAHLPDGLLDALLKNGIQIGHTPDADAQVGLTGALAGIAETGTLALPAGGGRPQSASLLPEYHLAILRIEDIYDSLEQVLKLPKIWQAANGVLVSGPSRTADIEMTLTIGVHGPRVVHVVCLMD